MRLKIGLEKRIFGVIFDNDTRLTDVADYWYVQSVLAEKPAQ